jgi:hypothetical protein
MENRTFDSPMDFEYENKASRIPLNSPWLGGTKTLQNSFGDPKSKSLYESHPVPI